MLQDEKKMTGKQVGDSLEALVKASAKAQEKQGLYLKKTSPGWVGGVGRNGEITKGRVIAKGELDYHGDYKGRSVMFDAKACTSRSSFRMSLVKRHQAVKLERAHERGAIAFFLVFIDGRYWAVQWPLFKAYWRRTIPLSIHSVVIRNNCVEVMLKGKHLDLIGVIEKLAGGEDEKLRS